MNTNIVQVPVDWAPRSYQMPLWSFLENGGKRAVAVWHRRAGKDATAINWTAVAALQRVGLYWHVLPTYNQGRKIVWDGITKDGRRFIEAFPKEYIRSINNSDMKIQLENGSMWQVVGSDNVDRLVGSNPIGVVFSEYSLQDPRAWDFIRPILAENGGWALFIYTPRGRNHGWDLAEMAERNPRWFSQVLTAENTGVINAQIIEEEREAGMPEEMVQQEFFCSWDAGLVGSFYSSQMAKVLEEGRICSIPYEPQIPVHTAWDLGMHDSTAIWFYQIVGMEIRLIDYYENSGEGLSFYVKMLQEKEYVYGDHWAPHDIEVRELGTGRSRMEVAASLGIRFKRVPRLAVHDGIEAVRNILGKCWFEETKTRRGYEALRQYRKVWNDKMRLFSQTPERDWSTHAADSFRYLAVALREKRTQDASRLQQTTQMEQYDYNSW